MAIQKVKIGDTIIGDGHPPFIIAELSGNHNGDIARALQIIDAAHRAGAHAIKLQTYTADTMTIDCRRPEFTIEGGLWSGRQLYELYQEAATPWDWHQALFDHARELGILVFSTPFDETAVEFLETLDAPAFKIASFELVDLPLIRRVAATGKPIIMSTGMADEIEIGEAVETAKSVGCNELILLHCVSGYPTPYEDSNVSTIADLRKRFGCIVGLSDHSLGTAVSVAAVAMGACVIEKHFTLSRHDGGVDSAFSLEPNELEMLVRDTAIAHDAIGKPGYDQKLSEAKNIQFRRSLFAVKDIRKGEKLTSENVRCIRPGYGLKPKHFDIVMGKIARKNISRGTPLEWNLLNQD
jgi:pseudaminic acid synthase